MKTNFFSTLVLLGILLSACTTPKYLPKSQDLDVNVYGSYIIIKPIIGSNVKGELLSVDTNHLTILIDSGKQNKVSFVPLNQIKGFTLRYAQPKNYWWTLFVFPAFSGFHGPYAVITLPVNLIIPAVISITAQNIFTYSQNDITYVQLRMFARFPAGMPADLVLTNEPKPKPRFAPHPGPGKK